MKLILWCEGVRLRIFKGNNLLGRGATIMDSELWIEQTTHEHLTSGQSSLEQAFNNGLEAFTAHVNALSEEQRSRLQSVLSDYAI